MMNLKNKRIAVFGMGVSGISALRFLKVLGAQTLAINSGEPETWAKSGGVLDWIVPEQCFSENDPRLDAMMKEVDLVILSPGIPRDHAVLKGIHQRNIPVSGELELAYRYLESANKLKPIIGITGTNGKTTTTTFLGEMIKEDSKKVFVGGNIGVPFCDYAYEVFNNRPEADYLLLELSSFQLESIDHFHVNIAIILNLYQNHGERYTNIEDYGLAKFNITNRFSEEDTLIYPEDFPFIKQWAQKQKGKKLTVNTKAPVSEYSLAKFKLPGLHNRVNLNFILHVAKVLGLSPEHVQKSIDTFPGVHHRIEYVDGVKGLPAFKVYNDAKSTNWDATVTAIEAMNDIPGNLYLIIGGKKRGHGDSILPHIEIFKQKVKELYLIGEMAGEIEAEVKGKLPYKVTGSLEETIKDLRENKAGEEGVVLFSPGFPSFDQFKNYAQRGERFMELLRS